MIKNIIKNLKPSSTLLMNEESNSEKIIWVKMGTTIDKPSITCRTPSVKKTVL